LIDEILHHGSISLINQNSPLIPTEEQDISKLKGILSWFLLEIARLLSSFEEYILSIRESMCAISQTDYIISLGKLADWVGPDFVNDLVEIIFSNEKQLRECIEIIKKSINSKKSKSKATKNKSKVKPKKSDEKRHIRIRRNKEKSPLKRSKKNKSKKS